MEANLNSELMQDALVCFRIGQEQVPQEPRLTGPDRSDPCCCKACCLASPLPLLQQVTSLRDNIKGSLSVAFLPLVLVFVGCPDFINNNVRPQSVSLSFFKPWQVLE